MGLRRTHHRIQALDLVVIAVAVAVAVDLDDAAGVSVLDALGDPTRRQIVERLRHGPMPVGQLAGTLSVGRPAVSKHLRVLEEAGLVLHRSHGTRNLYELSPEGPAALRQWLADTWDAVLAAFADHVHAQQEMPDDSLRKPRKGDPDDDDNASTARGRRARRR